MHSRNLLNITAMEIQEHKGMLSHKSKSPNNFHLQRQVKPQCQPELDPKLSSQQGRGNCRPDHQP
jgi:hypothetical protein